MNTATKQTFQTVHAH